MIFPHFPMAFPIVLVFLNLCGPQLWAPATLVVAEETVAPQFDW